MNKFGWLAVAGLAYCAVRAVDLLPRESAIKRGMCEQGKLYGLDWQWKQPANWKERFFGLQEVEYLR